MDLQEDVPTQSQAVSLEDRVKLLAEQAALQDKPSLVRALLLSHGHGAAQVRQSVTMMHSLVQTCFPKLLESKMRLMTKLICEDQILAKPGGCTVLRDEGYTPDDLISLLKLPVAKNGIEIGPGCFIFLYAMQSPGRRPAAWYWLELEAPCKLITFCFFHNDDSSEESNIVSILARFFLWSRYLNSDGSFTLREIYGTPVVDPREFDILQRSLCLFFVWISEQSQLQDVPLGISIQGRFLVESSRLTDVLCTKCKQATGIHLKAFVFDNRPHDRGMYEMDVFKRFLSELPNLEKLHVFLCTLWTGDEMDPLRPFFAKNYALTDFKCFGDSPWMRRCMQRNKKIGGKHFAKIDQLAKDIVKEEKTDKLLQALICSPRVRKIQSPAPMYAIVHTCFPQMLPSLQASSGTKLQAGMKRRREE